MIFQGYVGDNLNAHIKKEHYNMPHKSEIVADMARAQLFSKLDASQGYSTKCS